MLKKAEEGRGTAISIPSAATAANPTAATTDVRMPQWIAKALNRTENEVPPKDVLNFLTTQDLQDFFFEYVYVLPADVERIYELSTSQDNFSWHKERQVRHDLILPRETILRLGRMTERFIP